MSVTNRVKQEAHTDVCGIFQWRSKLVGGVTLAYSCIIALDENTYVYQYPEDGSEPRKIRIPMGEVFMFACDWVHGGQDLPDHPWNIRLHYLLKSVEFANGGDVQGWLQFRRGSGKFVYKSKGPADVKAKKK